MKKLYATLVATAAVCSLVSFGARADDTSGAAQDTKDAAKDTWHKTKDAASSAGETVENGAKTVGGAVKNGAKATGHAVKEGAEAVGNATEKAAKKGAEAVGLSKSDRERYDAYERHQIGEHRITGRVTSVDHDIGHVVLDSNGTMLNLHFPQDSLSNIETGQMVTVQTAFAKLPLPAENKQASAEPRHRRAYDAPGEDSFQKSNHWMTGTIDSIDHENGLVQLTAEKGTLLKVQFPKADVRNLKKGDQIAVELALSPIPTTKGDMETHPNQ